MTDQLDMGKWKGLFDWSMKFQDGTSPTDYNPEALTPEKKAWLEKALQDYMKDFVERMKEIKDVLNTETTQPARPVDTAESANSSSSQEAPLAEKEALCDELMEIVESVDYARDLHKIGGLSTLLGLMSSPHPSLRWRAAEITATCMANNPPVQRWFMEGGALPPLLGLLSDRNTVVQTKAVLALSALVRHYDQGLEAFRLAGGLQKLLGLLGCGTDRAVPESAQAGAEQQQQQAAGTQQQPANEGQQQQQQRRLQRKVLALLQYMLMKHPADGLASAEFGAAGPLRVILQVTDSDMRQAALAVLVEICSSPSGWQWVEKHEQGLLAQLAQLQQQHQQLGAEEQDAQQEEGQLLGQLIGLLRSAQPPTPEGVSGGLKDHVDLDPYQDGGERAQKTVNIRQPQAEEQEPSSSLSLMAIPKPELR